MQLKLGLKREGGKKIGVGFQVYPISGVDHQDLEKVVGIIVDKQVRITDGSNVIHDGESKTVNKINGSWVNFVGDEKNYRTNEVRTPIVPHFQILKANDSIDFLNEISRSLSDSTSFFSVMGKIRTIRKFVSVYLQQIK